MKKLVLILITTFALFGCGGNGGSKMPKVGEVTFVNQQCLSATSETAFDKLNRVCNRKDEAALSDMIEDGDVYIINSFEKGKMIKHSFGKCLVEFEGKGKVWIATEFIRTK